MNRYDGWNKIQWNNLNALERGESAYNSRLHTITNVVAPAPISKNVTTPLPIILISMNNNSQHLPIHCLVHVDTGWDLAAVSTTTKGLTSTEFRGYFNSIMSNWSGENSRLKCHVNTYKYLTINLSKTTIFPQVILILNNRNNEKWTKQYLWNY